MAASQARSGKGSYVEVEDAAGSGNFIRLAELTTVPKPSRTRDDIEVTSHDSDGDYKEFIPGLRDGGELSFDLNWVPGGNTDEFIEDWDDSGERRSMRTVFPTGRRYTFLAYVRDYSGSAPYNDKMTATLSVKVAGKPIRDQI